MTKDVEQLTDEELAEVREYHLGPGKPGCCADGQPINSHAPCKRCGAIDNDTCGRWVTKTDLHVKKLLATITALKAEVSDRDARVAALVGAVDDLIRNGLVLKGSPPVLQVIECADNSDPHAKLCALWGKNGEWPGLPTAARELLERVQELDHITDKQDEANEALLLANVELRVRAEAAEAEVEHLKARQRTPGTLEICPKCTAAKYCKVASGTHDVEMWDACKNLDCPLRTAEREG